MDTSRDKIIVRDVGNYAYRAFLVGLLIVLMYRISVWSTSKAESDKLMKEGVTKFLSEVLGSSSSVLLANLAIMLLRRYTSFPPEELFR